MMAHVTSYTSMTSSYSSALKAYHEATNERSAGLACLQQHIPTALQKLQLDKEKAIFNILSIGAGDGFIDQEILKFVQEGYLNGHDKEVKILNTAIEPNRMFLDHYKESIERRSDKVKANSSVDFNLKPMRFEEYVDRHHDDKEYDLVHAIHSLYHMDMESTLRHCYYDKLGHKGLILCLIANDSSLVVRASKILDKQHPEIECKRKPRGNPAANVLLVAEKNSMKYDTAIVHYSVDVTSVFDESCLQGGHLLDFFAHEDNYRQTADKEELAEVLQMLRGISTEDDRGRLIAKSENELIMIYKSP